MGLDVLACPRCHSRMELICAIEDPDVARRILRHLHLPARAPPRGRPWRPQRELCFERRADELEGVDEPAFID